jgi:predicted Zn finger-like uncharacterized protein
MITRCPDCQTAFRVTAAQLAARDGQVRCGHCAHVFDAAAYLLPGAATTAEEPAPESSRSGDAPPAPWPEVGAASGAAGLPAPEAIPSEQETYPAAEAPAVTTTPPPASSGAASELNFGPPPQAPGRRWPWVAGSLVLLLLLTVQGVFHFRSDIALLAPESKPLLVKACVLLECSISLPRRSELMSIEASDLQADATNPNVVILTATLRNRAAFAQANPALELTLTDAQDLPLARRVLLAGDYLDAAPDRDSGFAAGAERAIRLTLQLADIKATGYRLYLFYP